MEANEQGRVGHQFSILCVSALINPLQSGPKCTLRGLGIFNESFEHARITSITMYRNSKLELTM